MSAARNTGKFATNEASQPTDSILEEEADTSSVPTEEAVPEPTEDVFVEHVDPVHNHEFLDSHSVTAKQANDAWSEEFGVTFTKPMVWNKANKWRISAADFSQEQIDALLSDPQFREKRVARES